MIEGLDRLLNKLDKLNDDVIVRGLTKTALRVESEARENCPVGDGELRQSITSEVNNSNGNVDAIVGTNVEYAPYVEFGTGIYAEKGDGRQTPWRYKDAEENWHTTAGQNPQPFLRPAFINNKDKAVSDIKQAIKEALQ